MFGGVAFLINGHMACGVLDEVLVLRLGEEGADAALEKKHTRPMDFTGKPMKSMIYVDPAGFRGEKALKAWVDRAIAFARSLPPK
jgi:TfoX/Sxy family transcriptional regulator of competence genes